MKVKDLKEAIKDLHDDTIVILSSDEEGNSYLELREVDRTKWFPNEGYIGDSKEDLGLEEDEEFPEFVEAVVLSP